MNIFGGILSCFTALNLCVIVLGYQFLDTPKICGNVKKPEHGAVKCSPDTSGVFRNVLFGTQLKTNPSAGLSYKDQYIYTCRFKCDEGYRVIGTSVLKCPVEKITENPTCEIVDTTRYTGLSNDVLSTASPELITNADCGIPAIAPVFPSSNVVGGSKAKKGSYPWLANLREGFQFCGGALINDKWVVSAAHCWYYTNPKDTTIGLGFYQRDGVGDTKESHEYGVAEVFVHEKYNPSTLANDIALIQLDEAVTFTDYISPACLPDGPIQDTVECAETPIITGWGNTQGTAPEPDYLQQAKVPYIDDTTCNKPKWYDGEVLPGMFCAGYKDGGIDTCQGDSGGPVVCKAADGSYKLHGITSWGYGCAEPNHPGVYTRVYYFRHWIDKIIGNIGN